MKITPHTLSDIAALLGSTFAGDPAHTVTGLNEVHCVAHGDLMFVDHPKYYDKALKSAATTIIINKQVDCPEGKGLIFHDEPFTAYNKLVRHFQPLAYSLKPISDSAVVGEGTVIHPNVYIGNRCTVGRNCVLFPGVVLYDDCHLGDNVVIHANTVIGGEAFYYKRRPTHFEKLETCGRVIIHNDVEIGACCTIDRGVSGDTIIGRGTRFDNQVHIGHDTVVGEMCLFAGQVGVAGVARIGNNVILWGQVGVVSDVTIGDGAVVLGQSGIGRDVEGGKRYLGSPAGDARVMFREMLALRQLPDLIAEWEKKK
ncbi:MAG: UDP-3-O-3-hydroxymyristoyl glucosamine N-acyltransferase [Bacteroidetes bacterium]|nr:MAG: UDP-3-O-3-hydroxymyristoyl glucosamine N-acyltransferase [Bacteroidota bacterium]